MKKNLKILTLILSLAILTLAFAFAVGAESGNVAKVEGGEEYATFAEALANVPDGGKITLVGNATMDATYTVTKSFTLDLGGKTLNVTTTGAFVINEAHDVTITGTGTMKLAGNLIRSEVNAGVAYNFTVKGLEEGIDITHTGTGYGVRIADVKGGNNVFENIEIVSSSTNESADKIFFYAYNDSKNCTLALKNMSMYNVGKPGGQNALGFIYLGGGSTGTIDNCDIAVSGTPIHVAANTSRTLSNVLLTVTDSNLQIASIDNANRSNLIWVGGGNDSDSTVSGTIKFKNSTITGNAYRGVHGNTPVDNTTRFEIIFDNSVFANNGANDTNGSNDGKNNDYDTQLTRGTTLKFINGSVISTNSNSYIANSGVIYCEVGTRFNAANTGSCTGLKWIDADGKSVSGVKIVLDPMGNINSPYVGTTGSGYNFVGNPTVDMFTFEFARANNSGTTDGYYVNGSSKNRSVDYETAYEGLPKSGALTKANYDGNNSFKYWICPEYKTGSASTDVATANYGDTIKVGSSGCDAYFVFGDNAQYTNASAYITSNTEKGYVRSNVFVIDFDYGTDSEYGFTHTRLQITARNVNNRPCNPSEFIEVMNDGTIKNVNLKDFNSNIKFSTEKWNHITVVFYTDKTYTANGQMYFYVDGVLLGYLDTAFGTNSDGGAATYIQGMRFNHPNNSTQVVGSSMLIDNLMRRSYAGYIGDGEADGKAKDPSAYLLDLPKNETAVNRNITVYGNPAADFDEAVNSAAAQNAYVELKDDVIGTKVINKNVKIYTNGYTLGLSNEGYGADVELDGTTVTKYIFNEAYTDVATYKMFIGNDEYRTVTYKMGRTPALDTLVVYSEGGKYKAATVTGWSTKKGGSADTFLPVSKALAESGEAVNVYAITTNEKTITSYVKDAYGTVLSVQENNAETNTAFAALKNGETIVLTSNMSIISSTKFENRALNTVHGVKLDNDYTNAELETMKSYVDKIGFDLNGFTIELFNDKTFVFVSNNVEFNVYSSREGGYIYSRSAVIRTNNTTYGFYGLRIFGIYNGGKETGANALTVNNAHINVGKFGDIPGSNLTINGGVIFEGISGDNSCSINADGIIASRTVMDSSAAIMTRAYFGKIIIKNSAFIAPTASALIDLKGDDAYGYTVDGTLYEATPYVYIENSLLVNKGGDTNIVSDNSDSPEIAIELKNVIAAGRLNPSNEGQIKTKVNEGVGASNYAMGAINAPSTVYGSAVNYNVPIDLSKYVGTNIWKVQTPKLVSNTTGEVNDDIYVYVVTEGYESLAPEGATVYVLPRITTISALKTDVVDVNYLDADGKTEKTVKYMKGGNVNTAEYTAKTLTKNAITLNPTGEWEGETKNLQANVTLTSKYTAKSNVSGLQANLSLYTNFDLNLYIPAQYKDYVSVSDGTDNIVLVPVTVGGKDYLKAVISRNSNEATVGATYVITVNEAGYTASTTATLSIASYAEAILKGESYTEADKQLMYYMLTYANEAYKYFGDKTNYDATITALLTTYADAKGEGMAPQTYAKAIENLAFGTVITEATVNLGSAPAFVFTVADGFEGTITVTYAGNSKPLTIVGNKATVTGMKVYNFGADVIVTAEGTLNGEAITETATYNLDTFVKYHVDNAKSESETAEASKACVALLKALYDYVTCADIYTK